MPTKRIRVIDRTFDLLEVLTSADDELGVSDLARTLRLPKASVHRILVSLLDRRVVSLDSATERYSVGVALMKLAAATSRRPTLIDIAKPHLVQLRDEVGETTTLTLRMGLERVYVHQVETKQEIRFTVELGKSLPLYPGASGKAILAHLKPAERNRVVRAAARRGVGVDDDRLAAELGAIAERGFALSAGERVKGGSSVASAILADDGTPVGAIGVSGPDTRFTILRAEAIGEHVHAVAKQVEARLHPA